MNVHINSFTEFPWLFKWWGENFFYMVQSSQILFHNYNKFFVIGPLQERILIKQSWKPLRLQICNIQQIHKILLKFSGFLSWLSSNYPNNNQFALSSIGAKHYNSRIWKKFMKKGKKVIWVKIGHCSSRYIKKTFLECCRNISDQTMTSLYERPTGQNLILKT